MTSKPITTRRGGATSRLRGEPTRLLSASRPGPARQLSLLDDPDLPDDGERGPRQVLPGVVHVPGWLDGAAQRHLVQLFHTWALPPAGLRRPRLPTGHLMGVQSVCLGWHWWPYRYARTAEDTDGAPVKELPGELAELARSAVSTAAAGTAVFGSAPFHPDAAIVNYYEPGTRLGLHRDGEEPSDAAVVTISLGDRCLFRLAAVERRTGPFTDVELRSGDLLVFGGPNRRIYHGVPKVSGATAPDGLGLPSGRLSITVRQTGLT